MGPRHSCGQKALDSRHQAAGTSSHWEPEGIRGQWQAAEGTTGHWAAGNMSITRQQEPPGNRHLQALGTSGHQAPLPGTRNHQAAYIPSTSRHQQHQQAPRGTSWQWAPTGTIGQHQAHLPGTGQHQAALGTGHPCQAPSMRPQTPLDTTHP